MKRAKLFRMLAIGVILSLLVVLIPASPALAAREIDIDPNEGRIGDDIDIDEFVEDIPIKETRNYVKKVMKSYYGYKRTYSGG